jgi:hypothetical protein
MNYPPLQTFNYGWDTLSALSNNLSGSDNTAIGVGALSFNQTGSSNLALGTDALNANFTGSYNTAIGAGALPNATGNSNIALGYNAATAVFGGSNNIHIGAPGTFGDNATIRIGDPAAQTRSFLAGVRGTTTGISNAIPVVIDSLGQLGTISSSRRFKENIQDMGNTTRDLMRLRPVTFRYRKPFDDGSKPVHYGLIAEEVADVYPDLVAHSADGQVESVMYQELDAMLLNEVQRQDKVISAQEKTIVHLEERLARLEAALAAGSH